MITIMACDITGTSVLLPHARLPAILYYVVPLSQVARAHSQLSQYQARYGARLTGSNAFYVGNILRVLRVLLKFLNK